MTDLLFDPSTGDLLIKNGDLVIGDSTAQHQFDLVISNKAQYKQAPKRGVGIRDFVNDVGTMPGLTGIIHQELTADGQTVNKVTIEKGGKVTIDATY